MSPGWNWKALALASDFHGVSADVPSFVSFPDVPSRWNVRAGAGWAFADDRFACAAGWAGAARADQCDDDAVANGEACGLVAKSGDAACGFVAIDGGERAAPVSLGVGDIGVADGAGFQSDFNRAARRGGEVERFDRERLAEGVADGGANWSHEVEALVMGFWQGGCWSVVGTPKTDF